MDSVIKNRIFRSKIGWVAFLPVIIGIPLALFVWYQTRELSQPLVLAAVFILLNLYMFNTAYTITADNQLTVKTFFIKKIIDISSIKTIGKQTNSLEAAPALSFDRIEIAYNRYDEVVISPKDKEEFIARLKSINPAIEVKL